MILADASAWIEFLRRAGSPVAVRMRAHVAGGQLMTTDVVLMEVLAGARDRSHRESLRRLLGTCEYVAASPPLDFEEAADIYRACQAGGETVRKLLDCLVAAVAIRAGVSVLHRGRDFDKIARHTALALA